MTGKPSAVIFDLDGTLVDSARDLTQSLNHVLKLAGRPAMNISQVRHMVGDGARALIIKGFSETGSVPESSEIDVIQATFLDFYHANITDQTIVFPGALNVIKQLTALNIPLGLCTNKALKLSEKLIQEIGLAPYFSAVTGGDSFDYRKPDPRHLTATLDRMKAAPDRAIMVGDSSSDIIAAQRAEIPVIGVSFGYTKVPITSLSPDTIIDHFDDFFPALQKLTAKFLPKDNL